MLFNSNVSHSFGKLRSENQLTIGHLFNKMKPHHIYGLGPRGVCVGGQVNGGDERGRVWTRVHPCIPNMWIWEVVYMDHGKMNVPLSRSEAHCRRWVSYLFTLDIWLTRVTTHAYGMRMNKSYDKYFYFYGWGYICGKTTWHTFWLTCKIRSFYI